MSEISCVSKEYTQGLLRSRTLTRRHRVAGLHVAPAPGRQRVDQFPAKSYEDKNGTVQWQPLIEFAGGAKEARKQFQARALEAVHAVAADKDRGAA